MNLRPSYGVARPSQAVLAEVNANLAIRKVLDTLYRQITRVYPDREEAKDAAYQQLINVYNSDPSAPCGGTTSSQQILQTSALIRRSC